MTAPAAISADLVTDLRTAVDAALTDLLTAGPDLRLPAYVDLTNSLSRAESCVLGELTEAVAMIEAAHEHARFGEFAEARLLMVAGHRVLCAADAAPVRIPPNRSPAHDAVRPVPAG
ncbi:hypothetical protein BC739_004240 [Kutzneria viridogrisea]|uniref:Uncharacterized protein n=1 Tax=Kutzneria viridogrisea TaxID=47990 RepID=A0ABR6BJG5_9PSEU|nr:hypothetical protein [Kutzneria albida]MBA8927034.1 hypothetical protein [Kutzneria viridogrisea]